MVWTNNEQSQKTRSLKISAGNNSSLYYGLSLLLVTWYHFGFRMQEMKDDKNDMPADFDNEIHKWSLECKYSTAVNLWQ